MHPLLLPLRFYLSSLRWMACVYELCLTFVIALQ
jgi:hypothetical protein